MHTNYGCLDLVVVNGIFILNRDMCLCLWKVFHPVIQNLLSSGTSLKKQQTLNNAFSQVLLIVCCILSYLSIKKSCIGLDSHS